MMPEKIEGEYAPEYVHQNLVLVFGSDCVPCFASIQYSLTDTERASAPLGDASASLDAIQWMDVVGR